MQLTGASTELHLKIYKTNVLLHSLNKVFTFSKKPNLTPLFSRQKPFTMKQSVWGISTKSPMFCQNATLHQEDPLNESSVFFFLYKFYYLLLYLCIPFAEYKWFPLPVLLWLIKCLLCPWSC